MKIQTITNKAGKKVQLDEFDMQAEAEGKAINKIRSMTPRRGQVSHRQAERSDFKIAITGAA